MIPYSKKISWELTYIPGDSLYMYPEVTIDIPASASFNEAVRWLVKMYSEVLVLQGRLWLKFTSATLEADLTTYGSKF